MPWLALGITIGLMFAYLALLKNNWLGDNDEEELEEVVLEEYWADALFMRVYYNQDFNAAQADFSEYEENNVVRISVYTMGPPADAVQKKVEGEWIPVGAAIVRVIEGTREVVSVSYVKE